jgi:hypothetical protein
MGYRRRWPQKPQQQEMPIAALARIWTVIQIYALFQTMQVIAAWIPAVTTLIGVTYLFQKSAIRTRRVQDWYITVAQQPTLRRKGRLRHLRKSGYGNRLYQHRSTSALFRKTQRRHWPETESPFLSICYFYVRTALRLTGRGLSAIMADQDFLLSALPGFIPQAADSVTPSSIPLNPTQQIQNSESQPSQQQGDGTPSTSYLQSFVAIQPLPAPRSLESPTFDGYNLSTFLREYTRLCKRYQVSDVRACDFLEDYCTEDVGPEVRQIVSRSNNNLATLQSLLRAKYAAVDNERMLTTEGALEQFVLQAKERPYGDDLLSYSRQFQIIASRIEEAGNTISTGRKTTLYLRGLPRKIMEKAISSLRIQAMHMELVDFDRVVSFVDSVAQAATSRRIIEMEDIDGAVSRAVNRWRNPQRIALPIEKMATMPPFRSNRQEPLYPDLQREVRDQQSLSLDEMVERFKEMKLTKMEILKMFESPDLTYLTSTQRGDVLMRCLRLEPKPNPPVADYNGYLQRTQGSAPQMNNTMPIQPPMGAQYSPQQQQYANRGAEQRAPLECHGCGKTGHTVTRCWQIDKLVQQGYIHFGPNNRVVFGTAANPGREVPRLPPTNRYDALLETLGLNADQVDAAAQQSAGPANRAIALSHPFDGEDDSDREVYYGTRVEAIRALQTGGGKGKVGKLPQRDRIPTVRADRPGRYVPEVQDSQTQGRTLPPQDARNVQDSMEVDEDHLTGMPPSKPDNSKQAPRAQRLGDVLGKEDAAPAEIRVMNHILNMPVSIPVRDAINLMPGVRKLFTQPLRQEVADALKTPGRKDVFVNSQDTVAEDIDSQDDGPSSHNLSRPTGRERSSADNGLSVALLTTKQLDERLGNVKTYRAKCPRIAVRVGRKAVQALVDSGAEINVMKESFALSAGLPINSLPPAMKGDKLISANGTSDPFVGMVETRVFVGDTETSFWTPFLITKDCTSEVILGEPFALRSSMATSRTPSGRVTILMTTEDGTRTCEIRSINGYEKELGEDDGQGEGRVVQ